MIVGVLAASRSGEGVKSGPLGLAVILVLCVAVYFLFKSMSKHMKRVRDDFPDGSNVAKTAGGPAPQQPGPATIAPRPIEAAPDGPAPPGSS